MHVFQPRPKHRIEYSRKGDKREPGCYCELGPDASISAAVHFCHSKHKRYKWTMWKFEHGRRTSRRDVPHWRLQQGIVSTKPGQSLADARRELILAQWRPKKQEDC